MSSRSAKFCWSLATILLAPRGGQAALPTRRDRTDLFSWAAAAGFEGIELSPRWYDIFELSRESLRELRNDIEDAGLTVSGINVERAIVAASENAARNRRRIRSAIDVAPLLGAPLVDVALALDWEGVGERPPATGRDFSRSDFDTAVAEIRTLSRHAADKGLAVSIELHDDGLLDDATRCLAFIQAVGEPNCGANPDVGNICRAPRAPGAWESAMRTLAPVANCWHVKNYQNGAPAALDAGDIEYATAMEIMMTAGYQGWVSIESRVGDFRDTQSRSREYLRHLEREIHAKRRPVLEPVGNS